jgi:fumarylacetoacetase
MTAVNATHDPARWSWIDSANHADSDFPIQNLPLGVFHRPGEPLRGGVAIGDRIFDLAAAAQAGLFSGKTAKAASAASRPTLNPLMALGNPHASALRARLSELLRGDGPERRRVEALADRVLVRMGEARLALPAAIGGFTDFLCSSYHTTRMSLTGTPPPAFHHLPIGYNGRASSVRVSGEPVQRPNVQYRAPDGTVRFGPEPAQDFELELGFFVGRGNVLGTPIAIEDASEHIFGFCLLNDWSARELQRWEAQPLGPFLSKSFSTTISPWVVTAEALAPFRMAARPREPDAPALLPHLHCQADQSYGGLDLLLEAYLLTPRMREMGLVGDRVTCSNFRHMYWTPAQMLTHHASNGCNLRPGDLLGSGTVSGPTDDSRACLAELTSRGTEPLRLSNGETRTWLLDGDEVVFRARATREGSVAIGFGECRVRLDPAAAWPARHRVAAAE